MSKTVVLYHKGCPDGFGAAYIVQRAIDPEAILVPMDWHHQPPLELCVDAHVWSVDWLPDAEHIAAIAGVCESFLALDHHKSSLRELPPRETKFYFASTLGMLLDMSDLGALNKVSIVIDRDRSGAGLAKAFTEHVTGIYAPWWTRYVEDRDLWRFDFTDTPEVCAAIASYPQTVEAWDGLSQASQAAVVAEGRAILRWRNQLVEQCAASWVRVRLGGWDAACSVSPYAIGSDVAGLLAERSEEGIGAYCILHEHHVQFGLRSRNNGPDVAAIAERFGGGGHEHASGFTVDYGQFSTMMDDIY